jgi:hypothetical protein
MVNKRPRINKYIHHLTYVLNRATFVVTNAFAIIDVKNSRRNAKNHGEEASPEMADAGANNTTTATTDAV